MNDFYSHKPLAIWRIIFYGILGAAGVSAIGYLTHDNRYYFISIFAGASVIGLGFLFSWVRSNVQPIQVEPTQPKRYPKWIYWMFYGGLAISTALKLWDILKK